MTTEISIKELLEKYTNDHALLKHVLMAKSEEDKVKFFLDIFIIQSS